MGGFDDLGPINYFNGIQELLRAEGYAIYSPVTEPMNGSDVRGKQLAAFLDQLFECSCATKVNLIGHSQGGIDARYLVNVLGYGDRVSSVTTIASPHGGTAVADALLGSIPGAGDELVNFFIWLIGGIYTDLKEDPNARAALTWCSTEFQKEFTAEFPNDPQVAWFSYAGRAGLSADGKPECENAELPNPKNKTPMHAAMMPGWLFLGGMQGVDNDGLVTVANARIGRFRGCLPADHLQEVGLFLGVAFGYKHKEFFKSLAHFLVEEGH
jgi:triacylglycerol lipase